MGETILDAALERYEEYLREQSVTDDDHADAVWEAADEEITKAVEMAEDVVSGDQRSESLFADVYASESPRLRKQREWLTRFASEHDLLEE